MKVLAFVGFLRLTMEIYMNSNLSVGLQLDLLDTFSPRKNKSSLKGARNRFVMKLYSKSKSRSYKEQFLTNISIWTYVEEQNLKLDQMAEKFGCTFPIYCTASISQEQRTFLL